MSTADHDPALAAILVIRVVLSQATAPCKEWEVFLQKLGYRQRLHGFNRHCRSQAEHYAKSVAEFLGVPLEVVGRHSE